MKKSSGTLYWGEGPLAESDLTASGASWKEYVFFDDKRVARRDGSNNSVHFLFSDHLGSAAVIWNPSTSSIEEDMAYFAYGGVVSGTSTDHYMFTGKKRDTESVLDSYRFRSYSFSLGRWTSPDPFAGMADDPQSLNRYAYVLNNPVRFTDPLGLSNCDGVDDLTYVANCDNQTPLPVPDQPPAPSPLPSQGGNISDPQSGSGSGSSIGLNRATGEDNSDIDITIDMVNNARALAPAFNRGAAQVNTFAAAATVQASIVVGGMAGPTLVSTLPADAPGAGP